MYRVRGPRAATLAAVLVSGLLAACNPGFEGGGIDNKPVTGEVLGNGAIKVALLLPLSATGNAGQLARDMRNAADLAIREFQTAGIQVLVKDDRGTADGARAAASQAVSQGAKIILGPLIAQSVTAAASIGKSAGVPVVAFSTDASTASRGVYLISFLPQNDVERIVRFAAGQGKRSFAALLPGNAYGSVVEAALQRAAANAGGRVVVIERYNLDRTSMQEKAAALAASLKQGTVNALLIPEGGDAAPFIAQILAANGVKTSQVKYLGSGQWDDPRVIGESNLGGSWYAAPDRAGFDAFAQRYQAAFGARPLRAASLAYDATSLAAGLAGRFGESAFTDKVLTTPSGFIGIDGAFRLLPSGLNERGLAVYEIQRGQARVLSPAPKSFSRTGT